MDLNFKKTEAPTKSSWEDATFALHALAVISVHSEQGDEQKKTIRAIARADSYLADKEDTLLFSLMCAFGQHAVPVFEKYLANAGKDSSIDRYAFEIRRRLGEGVQS